MRRSFARRAALAGTTALLLIGPAATAHAVPDAPSDGTALPSDLVDAVSRDLGLTPEQYLDAANVGQQLARYAETARVAYPDAFAGVWLDGTLPVVGISDGVDADAARADATAAGFTVRDTAHSETALHGLAADAANWVAGQPPAIADLVRGIAIDVANNDVVLRSAAVGGVVLPDVLGGVRVVLAPQSIAPEPVANLVPAANPNDAGQLNAGDAYAAIGAGEGLRCSLGFNGLDSAGSPVNITAGHCDPSRATAGTANAAKVYQLLGEDLGAQLGTIESSRLDGHDFAIIRPTPESAGRFENNGVRVPGQPSLAVTGTADPVIGAPVCKSGLKTGYSCGVVTAVDQQNVEVGSRTLNDAFSTNLCALQGDSGGAIVTGTMALGVSSASNVGQYPACEVGNVVAGLLGDAPELTATPINAILADNPGLRVRTS